MAQGRGALAGASTPGLILPAVTPGAAGTYTVVVSNAGGSVLSEPAQLAVTAAPPAFCAITRPPAGAALTAGGSVVLTVGVTGTGPLACRWYKDGVALPGATGPELALRQVGPADAGDYEVEVVAGGSRRRSAAARVTVTVPVQAPHLLRQPRPAVAVAGGRAAFDLEVTAYPPPTSSGAAGTGHGDRAPPGRRWCWRRLLARDAGLYEVTVGNAAGTVTSAAVPLTVVAAPVAPVFWRQPGAVTAAAGRRVALTAEAGGAPARACLDGSGTESILRGRRRVNWCWRRWHRSTRDGTRSWRRTPPAGWNRWPCRCGPCAAIAPVSIAVNWAPADAGRCRCRQSLGRVSAGSTPPRAGFSGRTR